MPEQDAIQNTVQLGERLKPWIARGALVAVDDAGAGFTSLEYEGLMPSVYLEDGGRLRCQAVRGYRQIYDGMPATAGVIGRTFRSGEPTIVDDVAVSEDYLPAVAAMHEVKRRGRDGVLIAAQPTTSA